MIRRFLGFSCLALVVATVLLVGLYKSGRLDLQMVLRSAPEVTEQDQRGFRSDAIGMINRKREVFEVTTVQADDDLQGFLKEFVDTLEQPSELELEEVFDTLQKKFPGAQYLAANLVFAPTREELLAELMQWDATLNTDFATVNTTIFRSGRRVGLLAVMARRIPRFSLASANRGDGRFYNRCPHCDEVHALELDRDSRTLILSCPYCDLPFDVLASDTAGRIRRATAFFDGFVLEESVANRSQIGDIERVVALWKRVADQCEYQLDQDRLGDSSREVWKSARQTWGEKAGDCEDTSILLADILISAGYDARVAIGWNGNIGQHAWVVLQLGDEQFLLESTLQGEITRDCLSPISEVALFYQPEQLIDRGNLYFTTADPDDFRGDYFSREIWQAIPAPKPGNAASPRLSLR